MAKKPKQPTFKEKQAAMLIAHLKRICQALRELEPCDHYTYVPNILQLAVQVYDIDWVWCLRSSLFANFGSYQEAVETFNKLLVDRERATWIANPEAVNDIRLHCVALIESEISAHEQIGIIWGDRIDDFKVIPDGDDVVIQELNLRGEVMGEIARF